MAKDLDKVVNKAKALEIHQGPVFHLHQRLNNHDREAEAGKKQPLAWPWQLIFLALVFQMLPYSLQGCVVRSLYSTHFDFNVCRARGPLRREARP